MDLHGRKDADRPVERLLCAERPSAVDACERLARRVRTRPAKSKSNNTILAALRRMGYAGRMTGRGFRSVASTILHEQGFDHAHIELQLAHQERDEISAAYNYATYLPQRKKMMQWYADHLDALRQGISVRAAKR